jgi:hypothetical protein
MQYLAINTGKVVTPSLIAAAINNCVGVRNATKKTVGNYLREIVAAGLVTELDREYINPSGRKSSALSYNRTYYFTDKELFFYFYDLGKNELFLNCSHNEIDLHIALAKTAVFDYCNNKRFKVKSGVFVYYSHLEDGLSKKNSFGFDFVVSTDSGDTLVAFSNGKGFVGNSFSPEAKFAFQKLLQDRRVVIVSASDSFEMVFGKNFKYVSLSNVLEAGSEMEQMNTSYKMDKLLKIWE